MGGAEKAPQVGLEPTTLWITVTSTLNRGRATSASVLALNCLPSDVSTRSRDGPSFLPFAVISTNNCKATDTETDTRFRDDSTDLPRMTPFLLRDSSDSRRFASRTSSTASFRFQRASSIVASSLSGLMLWPVPAGLQCPARADACR